MVYERINLDELLNLQWLALDDFQRRKLDQACKAAVDSARPQLNFKTGNMRRSLDYSIDAIANQVILYIDEVKCPYAIYVEEKGKLKWSPTVRAFRSALKKNFSLKVDRVSAKQIEKMLMAMGITKILEDKTKRVRE